MLILRLLLFFAIVFVSIIASSTSSASVLAAESKIFNVQNFGAFADGLTDSTAAIQRAVDHAALKRGIVLIPAGTYILEGTVALKSNVRIIGEGQHSILKKKSAGNMMTAIGNIKRSNIIIEKLTFDIDYQPAASGILLSYVTNVKIIDCQFLNTTMWGVFLGSMDGTDPKIRNSNVTIQGCLFDGLAKTYEHFLILNSKNVHVKNSIFKNGADGNGIGIYQNARNVSVDHCVFAQMNTGLYYSLSTDQITVNRSLFSDNNSGMKGANLSDNGAFGRTQAKSIKVIQTTFTRNIMALRLGAIVNGIVADCKFERNLKNALVISEGHSVINSPSTNIIVIRNTFRDNNQHRTASILHAAIMVTGFSGNINLLIDRNLFIDEQENPSQLYPISFVGPYHWNGIIVKNSALNAYSGAESIGVTGGATFGRRFYVANRTQID